MSLVSLDEVDLVDHTRGLAPADADEHTLVQPIERGVRGLDLGGGTECVLTWVDVLASGQAPENLGTAVAHTPGLDVEDSAGVGLGRIVCQSALAPGTSFPWPRRGPVNVPPINGTIRLWPWAVSPSSSGWPSVASRR
jgi:hypothetical protein